MDNFINQKSDPMEFAISYGRIVITIPIILRKYVNTVFDKSKNGVLTVTDNNHLIVKAFATEWRYREMYEQYENKDRVIALAHTSPRNFFKYLSLAYMNPKNANEILSGKSKITITNLFNTAFTNQL